MFQFRDDLWYFSFSFWHNIQGTIFHVLELMTNLILTIKLPLRLPHVLPFVSFALVFVRCKLCFFCLNHVHFSWKCSDCRQIMYLSSVYYWSGRHASFFIAPTLVTKIPLSLVDAGKTLWMDPEAAWKWLEVNHCWCGLPYPGKSTVVPLYICFYPIWEWIYSSFSLNILPFRRSCLTYG